MPLGTLLADELCRYEEAEAAYRKTMALDPESAAPWCPLGNLLACHLGRYDEAEAAFRKAIELDEAEHAAWNGLGLFFRKYKIDYKRAIDCFQRGLEIKPEHPYLKMNLGRLLVVGGREEEGKEHLKIALGGFETADEGNSDYVNRLWLAVELNEAAAVERGLEAVHQRLKLNPHVWLHFAVMLAAQDREAARQSWGNVLAHLKSHCDTYQLLWILYQSAVIRSDFWADAASYAGEVLALPEERTGSFRDVPTPPHLLDNFRPFAEGLITGPGDPEDPLFQQL